MSEKQADSWEAGSYVDFSPVALLACEAFFEDVEPEDERERLIGIHRVQLGALLAQATAQYFLHRRSDA